MLKLVSINNSYKKILAHSISVNGTKLNKGKIIEIVSLFPQALLAGFSFGAGEHDVFQVGKSLREPKNLPIRDRSMCKNMFIQENSRFLLKSYFLGRPAEVHNDNLLWKHVWSQNNK